MADRQFLGPERTVGTLVRKGFHTCVERVPVFAKKWNDREHLCAGISVSEKTWEQALAAELRACGGILKGKDGGSDFRHRVFRQIFLIERSRKY